MTDQVSDNPLPERAPRPVRRWRARLVRAYLVAAAVAFVALLALAFQADYFALDLAISRAVQAVTAPGLPTLMWAVSIIGYAPQAWGMVIVTVLLLFAFGRRWEAVMAAVAAGGAYGLGSLVKAWVARPRPTADLVQVSVMVDSYSFPSGHVILYTAFFGFLLIVTYTTYRHSPARTLVLALLGALVALIGLSRIYQGNHWASDVTGAYLLGSLWLAVSVALYRWGKPRFFVRPPAATP